MKILINEIFTDSYLELVYTCVIDGTLIIKKHKIYWTFNIGQGIIKRKKPAGHSGLYLVIGDNLYYLNWLLRQQV